MKTGYLGIDVGLSGIRAVMISARGKILTQTRLRMDTGSLSPIRLSGLVDRAVRLAMAGQDDLSIAAIAICAFGPAPILFDHNGKVLAQLTMFATEPTPTSRREVADDGDDLVARIRNVRHQRPHLLKRTRFICDVTGYLVSRLTGRLTMDQVTASDYARLTLPRHISLPDRAAAQDHAGSLTIAAARRLGLPRGIPVATGTYDSVADLAAIGFGRDCRAAIVLGSTMVIGALTRAPVKDGRLRSTPYIGKGWFSGGWTNSAGSSLNLAGQLIASDGSTRSKTTPLLWPYFAGERAPVWSSQATGIVAGLTADTTASDLRLAFVQGVALSALDIADRLQAECGPIGKWTVTGGGTRNAKLMAELADALGAQLKVLRGAEANLGPAVLAARSCGVIVRLPVACGFRGNSRRHRAYVDRLRVYRSVFKAVRPFMGDIARVTTAGRLSA